MSTRRRPTYSLALLPVAVVAIVATIATQNLTSQERAEAAADSWKGLSRLVAVMNPTAGSKTKGTVTFTAESGKVKVVANIEGLEPNAKHAFHIHEWGDISKEDGTGTGGHYNPEGHDHGLPEKPMRHAGDLGNLQANASGKASYTITVDNVSLFGAKNPIVGRGVIVHAKVDDGGQPTGNAGARISQGVIGIAAAATE